MVAFIILIVYMDPSLFFDPVHVHAYDFIVVHARSDISVFVYMSALIFLIQRMLIHLIFIFVHASFAVLNHVHGAFFKIDFIHVHLIQRMPVRRI